VSQLGGLLTRHKRPTLGGEGHIIARDFDGDREDQGLMHMSDADTGLEAVLDATRQLLWIATPADATSVTMNLITALGGQTHPARSSPGNALPMNVSFGEGEPLLPCAPELSVARLLLERHLPTFILDAQRALELADKTVRLAEDASVDTLTGLANRRMMNRVVDRLDLNDTVIMVDLDHFKTVNDTAGHLEGDRVLKVLGRAIAATLRARDHASRYGGDEFLVVLGGDSDDLADPDSYLKRLQHEWEATRPRPITFSAGVAPTRPDPRRTLEAADRALYRAKSSGRDQWQEATMEDYR